MCCKYTLCSIDITFKPVITGCMIRVTRWAILVEQEPLALPGHMSSLLCFQQVSSCSILVFCVVFCRSVFCPLFLFYFYHCIVCPSISIYVFGSPTSSDYLFGIFKRFLSQFCMTGRRSNHSQIKYVNWSYNSLFKKVGHLSFSLRVLCVSSVDLLCILVC